MPLHASNHVNYRHGWLPTDRKFIRDYIRHKLKQVDIVYKDPQKNLHPVTKKWLNLVDTDSQANIYFTNMFTELPPEDKALLKNEAVTDYKTLIYLIDIIISTGPEYFTNGTDIVGVPIYLVLNYLINTPDGVNAFFYDKVNHIIFKVLEAWQNYLVMPDSATVLNTETGWLSPDALAKFQQRDGKPFTEMYVCDPKLPYYGFGSWDHFFARQLREGARPIDPNANVVSACESAVFRIATNIKASDEFWLKKPSPLFSYPYSLVHMLNAEEKYVTELEGGTVYQAFLSPFDYHRWHSPVDGVLEKIDVLPGTYYAAVPGSADENGGGALVNSQSFLTAVAARAIFYIRNPDIGLVAFMPIGMAEVSTCHVTTREGQSVTKGQELGMFHFGGSSHILIFNKETKLEWLQGIVKPDGTVAENQAVKINTGLAVATKITTKY